MSKLEQAIDAHKEKLRKERHVVDRFRNRVLEIYNQNVTEKIISVVILTSFLFYIIDGEWMPEDDSEMYQTSRRAQLFYTAFFTIEYSKLTFDDSKPASLTHAMHS